MCAVAVQGPAGSCKGSGLLYARIDRYIYIIYVIAGILSYGRTRLIGFLNKVNGQLALTRRVDCTSAIFLIYIIYVGGLVDVFVIHLYNDLTRLL